MDGASPTRPLLSIRSICVRFGGIAALQSVSFDVRPETICGVIGPNGAGKTTLFNCLSRLYQPWNGDISFKGHPLLHHGPHEISKLGLARTFQHTALFPSMTVRQNVLVGLHSRGRAGFWAGALRLPLARIEETRLGQWTDDVLDRLQLRGVADRPVHALPFARRKQVELARALVSRPSMLLLDEPAAGLNHEEVDALRETILQIRDHWKVAVLLVEHHMNVVMRTSDQVVALNFGCKIADGEPASVAANPEVIRAYLGGAGA